MLMSAVSLVLLGITAAGILGLASFWVGQRRRQIGVRRALGATRGDILKYFLTENLLIGIGGVLVGSLLAIGLNLWLMGSFALTRLSPELEADRAQAVAGIAAQPAQEHPGHPDGAA